MARSVRLPGASPVAFHRTKYGEELLVDAAWVRDMPTFRSNVARPHVLDFHDILLVTHGHGRFELDGESHPVAPGRVFFSRPGQRRRFDVRGLDGACLFFAEEFVAAFFRNPRFLDHIACFSGTRPSAWLDLGPGERRAFLRRFEAMRAEIAGRRRDAADALRAILHELLVLLGRWYADLHPPPPGPGDPTGLVRRLDALVERGFTRHRRVADYAAELGVTPGHLSAVCRREGGHGAHARIEARVLLEAKRLLLDEGTTVAEVGFRLGFADPAYFARFFRRGAGEPPTGWRRARRPPGSGAPPRIS